MEVNVIRNRHSASRHSCRACWPDPRAWDAAPESGAVWWWRSGGTTGLCKTFLLLTEVSWLFHHIYKFLVFCFCPSNVENITQRKQNISAKPLISLFSGRSRKRRGGDDSRSEWPWKCSRSFDSSEERGQNWQRFSRLTRNIFEVFTTELKSHCILVFRTQCKS